MNSEQSQPLIDFSDAKEPARSLELEKDTIPPEAENLEQNPLSENFDDQEKSADKVGEDQIISANISAG
ncbi:hypothetical protein [Calothrix sp. NIES-2098]|uniref:hypothetical protein n=1 Tax=Calothrix sp. NIES-2098 TaxID=1954171 RepID=UPI000B6122CB|nr:hypothetical protein NIES2098_70860 [Calothrix sp. NIES-2098]